VTQQAGTKKEAAAQYKAQGKEWSVAMMFRRERQSLKEGRRLRNNYLEAAADANATKYKRPVLALTVECAVQTLILHACLYRH